MTSKLPIIIATHGGNLPVVVGLYRNWLKVGFVWPNVLVVTNDQNINGIDLGDWNKIIVSKSNWRTEWRQAICKIQDLGIEKGIWYLDDFYLNSCPNYDYLKTSLAVDCKYLRLTPYERPLIRRNVFRNSGYEKVPYTHPYYCSLQAAIWDLNYLDEKLVSARNIWEFENQKGKGHLAHVKRVMRYRHSVEKGRWKWYSKLLYSKELKGLYNLKQAEKVISLESFKDIGRHLKFVVFGY